MGADGPIAIYCEVEYQEADACTGRNLCTMLCPKTTVIKRRSGLEVVSESPPLRKALKLQGHRHEVYFRYAHEGKIAFIRRDATKIYQFNIRRAKSDELIDLVRFSIRLGAVPKTPTAAPVAGRPNPPASRTISSVSAMAALTTSGATRKRPLSMNLPRTPLQDRSNIPMSPCARDMTRGGTTLAKRRRLGRASPPLTKDQQRVIDVIRAGKNVFFTGSAGTGKSFLLQQILQPHGPLREFLSGRRIFTTATTGIAAYNIGGMTLHHFAGLDPRVSTSSKEELLAFVKRRKDAVQRWKAADVLVVDEVSMLDGRLFDALEEIAREMRPGRRQAFFGGIQLILSGDFFQLPPVSSRQQIRPSLCFESNAWMQGIDETLELTQVFRQTNLEFVSILNALRLGRPTGAMIERLNEQCIGDGNDNDNPDAIRIYTHNNDVLEMNSQRLEELPGKKFNYISADTGRRDYLSSCPAPQTLALKRNAHVMLIKTINAGGGLVNGCRGVVVDFTPQTHLPIVRFANGSTEIIQQEEFPVRIAETLLASRRQLPLTLAWAISIHKSQGLAFPSAVVDLSRVFEYGQAYVALSRVRSLDGLRLLRPLDARRLVLADERVCRFYQRMRSH